MLKTRQQLVDYARSLIGSPYRHQGRSPKTGLDCIGVLCCIAWHFGHKFDDPSGYSRNPDGVELPTGFDKWLVALESPACLQPGDVISFWIRSRKRVQHAAVATDRGIIHAYHSVNPMGVIEVSLEEFWVKRVAKCYRFPEVEEGAKRWEFNWPFDPPQLVKEDPKVLKEVARQVEAMGKQCCGQ